MFSRKGFTLIELMIVLVIIGLLAAIAVPKLSSTRGKAYTASMKSDLKNLQIAEEGYYSDNQSYIAAAGVTGPTGTTTPPAAATGLVAGLDFIPSRGNKVVVVADAKGWQAQITRAGGESPASVGKCGAWGGSPSSYAGSAPADSTAGEGVPVCQ